VTPVGLPESARAALSDFVARTGLKPIHQSEGTAFAVNRLLVPLQERCLELLRAGAPPDTVDEASRSRLLPIGQLTLLDAVGLDTAAAALAWYGVPSSSPLRAGLEELVRLGKLGQKNSDGLRCGRPLPWSHPQAATPSAVDLERIFSETCERFLAAGELSGADLQVALAGLFGTTWSRS